MKKALASLGAMVALAAMTAVYAGNGAQHASATIRNAGDDVVGVAHFVEDSNGVVHVSVHTNGLSAGLHGIHVHTVGNCGNAFTAAGGHFNPGGASHGLGNPAGPHAGDLPNLTVNGAGLGRLTTKLERFTLSAGPTSLFDTDGSAIVIHAAEDDQISPPIGGSGARIACGVIVAG